MDTPVDGYCVSQFLCRQHGRKALPTCLGDKYDFKAIRVCFSGSSVQHAGDSPPIFLVVFIFSLKSIDRHKNPGNATKEKTNVQLRSKNPELRSRRGTGLLGVQEGAGGAIPTRQLAIGDSEGRRGRPAGSGYVNLCTMTALSRLASLRVWFSSASSLFGKVVMRTKLVAAMAGRASTMKSRMSLILWL